MEYQREQKRPLSHLPIQLDKDNKPVRKINKSNAISNSNMQVLRFQGKFIDRRSNGRLYPPAVDLVSKSTLPFSNCFSLLRYVGDGANGLISYTYKLAGERKIVGLENSLLKQENIFSVENFGAKVRRRHMNLRRH